MSEAPIIQEVSSSQSVSVANVPNTEVDKSIPEPGTAQLTAPEQPTTTAVTDLQTTPAEEKNNATSTEKSKDKDVSDKPEDLARSLLKGFQYKIAGVFPKKSEKSSDCKDDKKEEASDGKEAEKDTKDSKDRRSASRKRNSIFGGFGLGKKDDKPAEDPTNPEPIKDSQQEAVTDVNPVPEVAIASEHGAQPETIPERAGPVKRASIFGTLKNQFAKKEKPENLSTSNKEAETSSTSAPVIPAVGSGDYISQVPPKNDAEPESEATATVETKAEKNQTKVEKRKSSMPFGLGTSKKDKSHDEETTDKAVDKPLSPFAKFRATVKSKTSPRIIEKKDEVAPVPEGNEEPASRAILSQPESAVPNASPTVAASA